MVLVNNVLFHMKKTSLAVGSIMLGTLVLAGCFGTKSDSNNEFTIASCNDYVKLMKCVAEKSGGGQDALNAVDQAIAAWKSLPEDQLSQTCNAAMQTAVSNAAAYTQLGCEVSASNIPASTGTEVTTGTEMATSGEVAATGAALSGEDAVNAISNEVVTGSATTGQ